MAKGVKFKEKPGNPIMSMIVPGRRALGEDWSKVTVVHDGKGYKVEREDTPAPADNKPIFVPALGNLSMEMADYVLEYQRKEAEYRARNPNRPKPEDSFAEINRMWLDFVEWKLKAFKGQTVSGPAGTVQREKPAKTHWTRRK